MADKTRIAMAEREEAPDISGGEGKQRIMPNGDDGGSAKNGTSEYSPDKTDPHVGAPERSSPVETSESSPPPVPTDPALDSGDSDAAKTKKQPDHGENFVPGSEMAPSDMAPEPLDHFKRGYRERAELRDREMGHLNKDFDHDRKSRDVAGTNAGVTTLAGTKGEKEGSGKECTIGAGGRNESERDGGRGGGGQGGARRGSYGRSESGGGRTGWRNDGDRNPAGSRRSSYRDDRRCDRGGIRRGRRGERGESPPTTSEHVGFEVNALVDRIVSASGSSLEQELDRARDASPNSFESGKAVTAILSHLARRRKIGVALSVWSWMEKRKLPRNVFHYNSLISVCEKTRDWRRALDLLTDMERAGVQKNEVTFSSAISACEKSGNWQVAIDLLDKMKAEGVKQTPIAYNAAISACEKGLNPSKALEVYERMKAEDVKPTVITFSALISACEKGQQWKLALDVLDEMKVAGHGTNVIAYSAAISALSKGQQWEKALELFREIERSGSRPSVVTYNATMTALEKGLQWERALDLFDEMKARRMAVTVVSYGCAICACEKGYQWRQCLDYLDEMTQVGIEKNVIIFGAAMSCMEKSCRADIAFQLMDRMRMEGVHPNVHIYNSAISACARCDLWEKGYQLFREMDNVGLSKDVVTYNAVLDAVCSEVKLARSLFQEGVERGFYARVSRLGTQWLELDLHFLSLGGGEVALGWWFENALIPYLGNSSKLAAVKSIDIVTGYGKTRMRGTRQGNDGMRKRVRAMLHFMGVKEVEQPNKGRIHIDKVALQDEVKRSGGRIIFDSKGYEQWKKEQTTMHSVPDVPQVRRGRQGGEAATDHGSRHGHHHSQYDRRGDSSHSGQSHQRWYEDHTRSDRSHDSRAREDHKYCSRGRSDSSRHHWEKYPTSTDTRTPPQQNGSHYDYRHSHQDYHRRSARDEDTYHRERKGDYGRGDESVGRSSRHSYRHDPKCDDGRSGSAHHRRSLSPGEHYRPDNSNRGSEGANHYQNQFPTEAAGGKRDYTEHSDHHGRGYDGRGYAQKRHRGYG
mmetsp:Transcript_5102/g.14675  ORF Transcript_5102/g.14675 Transcript_5102/m.14675 type:complete len:1035 (-) Transcript_5102:490-3594(-)